MKVVVDSDVYISNGNSIEPNDNFVVENANASYGLSGLVLEGKGNLEGIPQYLVGGGTQHHYKGCYVVWFYDKKANRIYIANDLLSKQSVYYYANDGLILVNTSLFDLCSDLRANGRTPDIDLEAVEFFCKNNVFSGDMTYEKNTFFLTAYSYLTIDCEKRTLEVKKLPCPDMKKPGDISGNQAIEKMESLFSRACHMQWQKNVELNKDQIMTISGGMDSRAVLLHMVDLTDGRSVKTYTYSQAGSNDEKIAKKTTKRFGVANTFIPLDKCQFAFRRDEIIDANEGQMFYIGSTGAILMAEMCSRNDLPGIVHTGLGGGEILGDMCVVDGDDKQIPEVGMTENQRRNLDDIRRCLNFQKTTAPYFTAMSPFLDEDFFEYVMCLPASMRMHRKLYIRWYKEHMHADFPSVTSHSVVMKAFNRVKIKAYKLAGKRNPADMNPIQYWYDTKPELRDYIKKTWETDCEVLSEQTALINTLTQYFNQGVVQKFAALTVTGAVQKIMGYR